MRVVLASASPSRRRLLVAAGIDPVVMVSDVDEDEVVNAERLTDPGQIALVLAQAKADDVALRCAADEIVVGCDSVLEFEGRALGKPGSAEAARERWRRMRGRSGWLLTGHSVVVGRRRLSELARTRVDFAEADDSEIDAYIATGEPLHVAGGFTLDGVGSAFVSGIDGDASNVIGLSIPLLRTMLGRLGVPWPSLWSSRRDVGVDVRDESGGD